MSVHFGSFTSENSCCGNGQGATPALLRALRPPREAGLHRAGVRSPAGCSLPACGCWALGAGAGWLLTGTGVTPRLVCVKGIDSVPFGKGFVDLKDTANLWSI